MSNLLSWLGVISISLAWHFPGSITCAILSWIGCFLLAAYLPRASRPYSIMYSAGIALYAIGFYWLFFTIRDFGGFNNLISFSIFLLFISVSALQFVVLVFVWKNLPEIFRKTSLALAMGWLCSEMLSIRIFPWYLGHSQLAYTYLAQVADLGGAVPISFLMIWLSSAIVDAARRKRIGAGFVLAAGVFVAANVYGYFSAARVLTGQFPKQNVTLVQANISLEEKHNMLMPQVNVDRYIALSKPYSNKDTILIWPESVITDFVYANLGNVSEEPHRRLPFFENTPVLLGALTYESRERFFNTAIGISGSGEIVGTYHKQILMPFGEYTPFAESLPWLQDINSTAGQFSAGNGVKLINFKNAKGEIVKMSPLICYEDVIPEMARLASNIGAEVLVNITNDAWFGNTIAPHEHNLIASFRAIENKKYLLRSTNSGLTAIISPLGKTLAFLPPYSEGILDYEIERINIKTLSSYFDYQFVLRLIAIFFFFWAAFSRSKKFSLKRDV